MTPTKLATLASGNHLAGCHHPFFGVSLSLPQRVGALTVARLSILMLLPAGLGALEAGQAAAFALLGLVPTVGISAALLIRLRDMKLGLLGLW